MADAHTPRNDTPDSPAPGVEDFAWVRPRFGDAGACLTFVDGAGPAQVIEAFGGDPSQTRTSTLPELTHPGESIATEGLATDDGTSRIAVRAVGERMVLVVEPNGWQGSRPEVLRRVSAGARATSTFWNVNGVGRFSYAENATVLTAFEPLTPTQRHGGEPDHLEAVRADLPWDTGDPVALMLALAARTTGAVLEPDWLDGEFTIAQARPLADDVPATIVAEIQPLTYDDPVLAYVLRTATPQAQRAAARAAVDLALTASDLHAQPLIAAATATDPPTGSTELDGLHRRSLAAVRRSKGTDPLVRGRYYAIDALREATSPDPLAAAFKAVTAAATGLQILGTRTGEQLRPALLHALGDPPAPAGSMGLRSRPGPDPLDRYRWITRHWLAPAAGLAFFPGQSVDDTIKALGLEPSHARTAVPHLSDQPTLALSHQPDQAQDHDGESYRGGGVLALNLGPATGIDRQTLKRLSPAHGTGVVRCVWEARGRIRLWYAVDGHELADFDPQRPDQLGGDDPDTVIRHLGDLHLPLPGAGSTDHIPVVLLLTERLTGISLTPHLLDTPQLLLTIEQDR